MPAWITAADLQTWFAGDIDAPTATALASDATDAVRDYLERDLALQELTEAYDTTGTNYVLLNFWPVRAVTQVVLNGTTVVPPAAFNTPGWRLSPIVPRKLEFPGYAKLARSTMNLSVSYTAGYDLAAAAGDPMAIPGSVATAIKLTAAAMWNAQAADPNLSGESTGGVFSGQFYPTGVGAVPPGARSLLQVHKRVAP